MNIYMGSPSRVQETRANLGTSLWEAICERCRRSRRPWRRRKRPVEQFTPEKTLRFKMEVDTWNLHDGDSNFRMFMRTWTDDAWEVIGLIFEHAVIDAMDTPGKQATTHVVIVQHGRQSIVFCFLFCWVVFGVATD